MESQKESLNSFLAMFPSWWNPSFATYTTFLQKPSSSTTRKQRYLQGSHAVKGQVTVESAGAGRERTGSLSGVGEGGPDFFLCFSLWMGNVGHWCFVCTLHRPHNESHVRQCMKKKPLQLENMIIMGKELVGFSYQLIHIWIRIWFFLKLS